MWGQVLRYCQSWPVGEGGLSPYHFEAQAGLTLDVKPLNEGWMLPQALLNGMFFSERYHQHTLFDIVESVREGALDNKVLTYPELLEGRDTTIVYFWPDVKALSQEGTVNDPLLSRKVHELFESLMRQSIRHL